MDNNSNIAPKWAGFRKLWIIVALILFLLLLLLMLAGYSPWGTKCDVAPTIVEKIVEKEKLVDNPELLTRIGILEKENEVIAVLKKENAQIAGLKSKVAELSKSTGLVAGLQAKIKALEAVDLNFENPALMSKINLLETENASIADMKKRIIELEATSAENSALSAKIAGLETENGLIAGLKAKVAALEAVDVNFIQPEDNTELLQKISGLEAKNLAIPVLESRIKNMESKEPELITIIDELKTKNGLIPGLKAKVSALEAIDINFIQPEDNTELLQKISGLEAKNLSIPVLESRIKTLESKQPELIKTIDDLKTENGLIPGLKAKVAALEAVDVNFIKPEDNTDLLQQIKTLASRNLAIPVLESRIKTLESKEPELIKTIDELKTENGLIPGLKAKVAALEAIDVNFIKPEDNTGLLQKINNLEVKTLAIPSLESRIQTLQSEKPILTKRIGELEKKNSELETENGLIPGLQAKVKVLEAVDVNFIKPQDNTELLQKINNLEVKTLAIPSLESRIQTLLSEKPVLNKRIDELEKKNGELVTENGLIPGLQAKVKALEAIDINFISANASNPVKVLPKAANLYFDPGSSRFPKDANQSMADVIVFLRANSDSKVSLAGFHDATGNANWNRRLSTRRSNRVKQILLDAGIPSNRINVEIPTQTLGTGLPEEARRVEVRVSN